MKRQEKSIGKCILKGLAFIGIAACVTAAVMLLWNAVIPAVIGWSAITYWQAAGIFILSRILFGKFGRPGECGKCCGKEKEIKKGQIQEKLKNMSPDERREYIRNQMSKHKRFWCDDNEVDECECECEDPENGTDTTK